MKTTDEGIFISYKEIEDISRTVGYLALTVLAARLIGYMLTPAIIKVEL